MLLNKQAFILDLFAAFWTVTFFLGLFFWLPFKISPIYKKIPIASQLAGIWSRMMFVAIAAVLALNALQLLNWLTLTFIYCLALFANYIERCSRNQKQDLPLGQSWLLGLVDIFDRGISLEIGKNISKSWYLLKQKVNDYLQVATNRGMLFVLLLTAILSFALLLRWQFPLLELRFTHPDSYGTLLVTRQMLAGDRPDTVYFPTFSALAVVLSLLGSIEPMQVIRFLGAILGVLMVLSVGYCVDVLSKNTYAALVAMLALGAYLFTWEPTILNELPEKQWLLAIAENLNASQIRQWAGSELELGAIFVLVGVGYFFEAANRQKPFIWLNLLSALMMIVLSAPILLILVVCAGIGTIGGKRLTLALISTAWVALGVLAAMPNGEFGWARSFLLTLPIGLSLLAGLLFLAIARLVRLLLGKWSEQFCLALVCAVAVNFLLPLPPVPTYLEYEITARKSIELSKQFPRHSWTLVAPTEQLAEIYGSGWYEDLALFVEKYAAKAKGAKFDFPTSGKHLFVFVEKIPFVTFPNEPAILPDNILSDRTYRYYRSSAGRASLEYEALQMCEAYRSNHPQSEIYYENEELRVYHFVLSNLHK